jgi:chromosome segregation ATPase
MIKPTVFCLLIAVFLGFIIAWFVSKKSTRKREQARVKVLTNVVTEKENQLEKLESANMEKENRLNRLIDEGIVCRHQLLQQSNYLRKKSDELYKAQKRLDRVGDRKKSGGIFEKQILDSQNKIRKLESIINKKNRTILSFKSENKSRSEYLEKNELIEISQDQFNEIEKRLLEYQKKADNLEYENSKLLAKSKLKKESTFLKDTNLYLSNLKEITLSNFLTKQHTLKKI